MHIVLIITGGLLIWLLIALGLAILLGKMAALGRNHERDHEQD
jgi:hypothetical protein